MRWGVALRFPELPELEQLPWIYDNEDYIISVSAELAADVQNQR
jgi:hypothetical protein